MRRRSLLLVLLILLFAGAVQASALRIEQPDSAVVAGTVQPLEVGLERPVANLTYRVNGVFRGSCSCVTDPAAVQLRNGENMIRVRAVDPNTSEVYTASTAVTVDASPPNLTALAPNGTIHTRTPHITASFNDASGIDTSAVTVTLDGRPIGGTVLPTTFRSTVGQELERGPHRIRLTLADTAGNSRVYEETFFVTRSLAFEDRKPRGTVGTREVGLGVTVQSDEAIDPSRWRLAVLGVSRTNYNYDRFVDDELRHTVAADGRQVRFTAPDQFLQSDGRYRVRVQRRTDTGYTTFASWSFTVDTRPPTINLSTVRNMTVTGDVRKDITVEDRLSDVATVKVGIDGRDVWFEHGGRLDVQLDAGGVPDGRNTVTVWANDSLGNAGSSQARISVNTEPPQFAGIELLPGTASSRLRVLGRLEDGALVDNVAYTAGKDSVKGRIPVKNGWFNRTIDVRLVQEGVRTVTFQATDTDGRQAVTTRSFVKDATVRTGIDVEPANRSVTVSEPGTTVWLRLRNTGAVRDYVTFQGSSQLDIETPAPVQVAPNATVYLPVTVAAGDVSGRAQLSIKAEGLSASDSLTMTVEKAPEERSVTGLVAFSRSPLAASVFILLAAVLAVGYTFWQSRFDLGSVSRPFDGADRHEMSNGGEGGGVERSTVRVRTEE